MQNITFFGSNFCKSMYFMLTLLVMERSIIKQLRQWQGDPKRKPLIFMGARQVGKTYILKQFASSEYENYIYLNFEDNPELKLLFENSLAPGVILKAVALEKGVQVKAEKTLIIFDEVQECPNALNSLKYFNESANEYHICAAGSLLGVRLAHTKGFPVGKVNFLHLYPLSFLEFLQAINEEGLKEYLEEVNTIQPLAENLHQKLLKYFKHYLFIGGMPEAVAEYIDSEDFAKVRKVHQEILQAYSLDFAKHAPKDSIMKINQVWDAIPNQLAKSNTKKFVYSIIRKGARAKEFEVAIQWLKEAGLIHKVYNISTPKLPLQAYANFDFFKIYLADVGLLGAMADLSAKLILRQHELFQEFRGSLVENYITQELAHGEAGLYYWTSEGKAEVDFVFQHEDNIYPLEIKSGNSDKKKSLRVYADKYQPDLLLRASPMNLRQDGNILNCPLYLIGRLKELL